MAGPGHNDDTPVPGPAALRRLVGQALVGDADLVAFCLDYFPAVEQRFGGDMDRVTKTNLLLRHADPRELFLRLQERCPEAVAALGPEPAYPDERSRGLGEQLEALYGRRKAVLLSGGDPAPLDAEILALRRQLRDGPQLQAGEFLSAGRYHLIERIGQGGFASVWKAYDHQRNGLVAIKVLHGQWAHDQSRLQRFRRGARRMAELRHPNVVRVLEDRGEDAGFHYFVMEFMPGGDLRQAVLAGRLGPGAGLRAIVEAGAGLQHAHEQGIIHRDVKPANILLDGEGRARLTDFDLVRAVDTTGGTRSGALGTVIYSAPEVMENARGAEVAADVFSLGMTALFVLHGRELPVKVLRESDRVIGALGCPAPLKAVLRTAVEWEPAARFASVKDFCRALAAELPPDGSWAPAGAGPDQVAGAEGPATDRLPRRASWARRNLRALLLAAVAVLLAAGSAATDLALRTEERALSEGFRKTFEMSARKGLAPGAGAETKAAVPAREPASLFPEDMLRVLRRSSTDDELLKMAQRAFRNEDCEAVQVYLRLVLERSPESHAALKLKQRRCEVRQDIDDILRQAQDYYVNGDYLKAIEVARPLCLGPAASRAWRLIGGAACNSRDAKLATDAYKHLDGTTRQFVLYVCHRNGMQFHDNRFQPID